MDLHYSADTQGAILQKNFQRPIAINISALVGHVGRRTRQSITFEYAKGI